MGIPSLDEMDYHLLDGSPPSAGGFSLSSSRSRSVSPQSDLGEGDGNGGGDDEGAGEQDEDNSEGSCDQHPLSSTVSSGEHEADDAREEVSSDSCRQRASGHTSSSSGEMPRPEKIWEAIRPSLQQPGKKIDALTTRRAENGGWVVERVLNQLLVELDGADQRHGVYVIGATNRIDVIDEAVLRHGRFGKKFFVPLPGADERAAILKAIAKDKCFSKDIDLDSLARREECNNLSGANLASLVNEAAMVFLEGGTGLLENGTSWTISSSDSELSHFERALSKVKPSVTEEQREYFDMLSKKYSAD